MASPRNPSQFAACRQKITRHFQPTKKHINLQSQEVLTLIFYNLVAPSNMLHQIKDPQLMASLYRIKEPYIISLMESNYADTEQVSITTIESSQET